MQLDLTFDAAPVPTGDRTVTGLVAPWGRIGKTAQGVFQLRPGSIRVPSDPGQVKALVRHDHAASVGYGVEFWASERGLHGRLAIAPGPAGDAALAAVRDRTTDGLSVGLTVTEFERLPNGVVDVLGADLREVSLVSVPAFPDSWVTHDHTPAPSTANTTQEVAAMADSTTSTTTPATTPATTETTTAPATTETAPTAATAPVTAPKVVTGDDAAKITNSNAERVTVQASAAQHTTPVTTTPPFLSLEAAAELMAELMGKGNYGAVDAAIHALTPLTITAALADITPTSLGNDSGFMRPDWIGELYKARRVERPLIDLMNNKPLKSTRIRGFEWVGGPEVGPYAGDKTAIPTNSWTLQEVEKKPKRWAGGWDVDRIYVDLGDGAFLQEILSRAFDDYLLKTEADAAADLIAGATAVTATTIPGLLAKMAATVRPLGGVLSRFLLAPDVFESLLNTSEANVPWWMKSAVSGSASVGILSGNGTASDAAFQVDPSLPAGNVVAFDRRAATWFETPAVRVQALNIPNAGVDVALYGYGGLLIEDKRVVLRGTVTP